MIEITCSTPPIDPTVPLIPESEAVSGDHAFLSSKDIRMAIPHVLADYYIQPYTGDLAACLIGQWYENPLNDATAFVAESTDCFVLTEEGPLAVEKGDSVWVVYSYSTLDLGVIFVPRALR